VDCIRALLSNVYASSRSTGYNTSRSVRFQCKIAMLREVSNAIAFTSLGKRIDRQYPVAYLMGCDKSTGLRESHGHV
jgi:hypothetical protein